MSERRTRMNESQIDRRIDRRIDFLIREAKSEILIPDQVITYAFRVITNYLSVGYDARSRALSAKCPYRSKKAFDLSRLDPEGWLDKVTNEHQYPIKDAWNWMKRERDKLTVQRVKSHLENWPVVVVTKDENKELRKVDKALRKVGPAVEPDQRYLKAKIKVLEEIKPGKWQLWKSRNQISE